MVWLSIVQDSIPIAITDEYFFLPAWLGNSLGRDEDAGLKNAASGLMRVMDVFKRKLGPELLSISK